MKESLVSRGLTQEKLAEDLDVTPRYLAGIERGERNLTLDSIDALAEALRVDSVALLTVGVDASTTTQRL